MIVEDDKTICKELKELLENASYEVILLENFEYAYEEIIKASPDLILLDINIPYLSGEILLKKIREIKIKKKFFIKKINYLKKKKKKKIKY